MIDLDLITFSSELSGSANFPVNDFELISPLTFFSPTLNLTVKISSKNFNYILDNATLIKRKIKEFMVISRISGSTYLFIEGTEEYNICLNNKNNKLKLKESKSYVISFLKYPKFLEEDFDYRIIENINEIEATYLGSFYQKKMRLHTPAETIHQQGNICKVFVFKSDYGYFYFYNRKSFQLKKENGIVETEDFCFIQNKEEEKLFLKKVEEFSPRYFFDYYFKKENKVKDWLKTFTSFETTFSN